MIVRSITKIFGVNLAILVIVLTITELAFGNWLVGPNYRDMNIPRNFEKKMDVSAIYELGGTITYSRDEHGLRGEYVDSSQIDILTLGGSTTNQLIIDDAETWQAVMAKSFAATGVDVSVVNAGVEGQSTLGHLAVFDRWFPQIPDIRSKYILVYAGINDTAIFDDPQQYDEMRSPSFSRRVAQSIKNKSVLYEIYTTVRGIIRAHEVQLIHGKRPVSISTWERHRSTTDTPSESPLVADMLTGYGARIKKLAGRIRSFGAEPIFVTQPSADYRVRDEWLWVPSGIGRDAMANLERLEAFNRTTLRACREVSAICINLAHEIRFEDGDFYDFVHYTANGSKRIGTYLHSKLNHLFQAD